MFLHNFNTFKCTPKEHERKVTSSLHFIFLLHLKHYFLPSNNQQKAFLAIPVKAWRLECYHLTYSTTPSLLTTNSTANFQPGLGDSCFVLLSISLFYLTDDCFNSFCSFGNLFRDHPGFCKILPQGRLTPLFHTTYQN